MPFILGLTGGIGSGKTVASNRFATHGIEVVDADHIAREIVHTNPSTLRDISAHFGPEALKSDGSLDRELLRQRIFNNHSEKQWLEKLLHPIIRQQIIQQATQACSPYVIVAAPLLLETSLVKFVDRVLVIDCDEDLQVLRSVQRDKSSAETIKKIMQQQLNRSERLNLADDIIENNGSLDQLCQDVDRYHEQLMDAINYGN